MRSSARTLILLFGVLLLGGCNAALTTVTTTPLPLPTALQATPGSSDTPAPTETPTETPMLPAPLASPTLAPHHPATLRPLPTIIVRASPVNPDTNMEGLVTQARADLAARLGVAASTITVLSAQTVEWPDGSLGCPKPGFMYSQIVTPGVLIVLQANGQTFEYHGTRARVSLCEKK